MRKLTAALPFFAAGLGACDGGETSNGNVTSQVAGGDERTRAPEGLVVLQHAPGKARPQGAQAHALSGGGMHDEAIEHLQRALVSEEDSLRQRSLREDLERLRTLQSEADDGH